MLHESQSQAIARRKVGDLGEISDLLRDERYYTYQHTTVHCNCRLLPELLFPTHIGHTRSQSSGHRHCRTPITRSASERN